MEAYIGEIRLFAGSYAPEGWEMCDGRSLSISDHEALYSLIGDTWGGDTQSFRLPNLMGRVPIGSGTGTGLSPRILGQTGGAAEAFAELPAHSHRFMASKADATSGDPNTLMLAKVVPSSTTSGLYLNASGKAQVMAGDSLTKSGTGGAHENVMPSLALTYIICLIGEYPTET